MAEKAMPDSKSAGAPEIAKRAGIFLRDRWLTVAVIAAVLAAGIGWLITRATPVTVAGVTRGTAVEIVYATGAVEPLQWAKVATIVKGRIVERCRCEGKPVKAGDLLARLDDAEAQATLRELKAREDFLRKEFDRQNQLATRGFTSTQSLERTDSELRQVQALIAAQAERLANFRLLAPMDGIVLREDGEVGEIVDSNVVLYRIGVPTPLQLVAEVNEEDIPRVQIGYTVLLRSDAFAGNQLSGTVREITPAGDPVAKTYRIRMALPRDTPLRVGMTVEANVVTRKKDSVLLIPAAAVRAGAVFVVQGNRVIRRPVSIGVRGAQAVEVQSGLNEGEQVVSPVPETMEDGSRIRITGSASPAKK
jgi:membrane fusion protein (multidrug efflux system)